MKRGTMLIYGIIILLMSTFFSNVAQAQKVSAVYGGGPFYYSANQTVAELRKSGFTTAIVWTIHIAQNGNFNFNMEFPIVENGTYIGDRKYPNFPKNMALLKTPPTSVTRIEVGLDAWEGQTFKNIERLINAQGTGPNSILYKNFKALKEKVPAIDALNFDDESNYDVASTVKFAVMVADLGFKVALCPYTRSSFWRSVAQQTNQQRPGAVDAIFLQCYAGGASNNPASSSWKFGNLPVYPGLWSKDFSPSRVQSKMRGWKNSAGCKGGFMWLYDEFQQTSKTKQYANAINTAFSIGAPGRATLVSPADDTTGVSCTTKLQWKADFSAQSHDVYFGKDNPPPLIGNQAEVGYTPNELSPNTKYYWRVDEKNFFGKTTGQVWSFTTEGGSAIANTIINRNSYNVIQSYPNPFIKNTNIKINIPQKATISVSILNQSGQEVISLAHQIPCIGQTSFSWQGQNNWGQKVSSGVYLLYLKIFENNGNITVSNSKILYQK